MDLQAAAAFRARGAWASRAYPPDRARALLAMRRALRSAAARAGSAVARENPVLKGRLRVISAQCRKSGSPGTDVEIVGPGVESMGISYSGQC